MRRRDSEDLVDLVQDHGDWEDENSQEMDTRMRSLLGRVTLVSGGESPMTGGDGGYSIR